MDNQSADIGSLLKDKRVRLLLIIVLSMLFGKDVALSVLTPLVNTIGAFIPA